MGGDWGYVLFPRWGGYSSYEELVAMRDIVVAINLQRIPKKQGYIPK